MKSGLGLDPSPVAQAGTNRPGRSAWIDVARGIGIFLVVLAHAERGIVRANVAPSTMMSLAADQAIYAFHMPLFFMLAGLHVGHGLRHGRGPFLRDKLVTIVWPYFLWSAIYVGVSMAVGTVNQPLDLSDMAKIPWQPVAHFWFLYALLLCHLVAAAIWPNRWLLAGAAIALALAWIFLEHRSIATQMAQMFPFFAIGVIAGPAIGNREIGLHRIAPALAAGGMLLLVAVQMMVGQSTLSSLAFAPYFYAGALAGIAAVVGISLLIGARFAWLRRMGQASMAIFVIHTFFAAGLRIMLTRSGVEMDHLVLLALSCLCAIVGPWMMYEYFGRRGLNPLLGLGKYVRS